MYINKKGASVETPYIHGSTNWLQFGIRLFYQIVIQIIIGNESVRFINDNITKNIFHRLKCALATIVIVEK